MLKMSTRGEYGVRAMFEIAKGYPDEPVTIKEISSRQGISTAYLEQILNSLRKAGFITSVKGPGGGYLLSRSPETISIGDVLIELEGPVAISACSDPSGTGCDRVENCLPSLLWKALGEKIEAFLRTVTLSDLMNEKTLRKYIKRTVGA